MSAISWIMLSTKGNKIYKNTDVANAFLIFHDELTQWWEKQSQEYLHSVHSFRDRQVRCYGNTNKGTRYHNKVVGNSPEMCRALDSHGFADFKVSIAYHVSLTSVYDKEDPRRFLTGTPEDLWKTMTRCWEVEPTSERIVTDILNFPEVLRKIIAYNGTVIPNEALRSGRRAYSKTNKELKNKPRLSQRKTTMTIRPTHPDALEARLLILNGEFSKTSKKIFIQTMSKTSSNKDKKLLANYDADHCLAFPYNNIVEI